MIRDRLDGIVCDLDGVIYRGDRAIEGAADAVKSLMAAGTELVFCTNNSRTTTAGYVDKLAGMGIEVAPERILTSGVVLAEMLAGRGYSGDRALVVGGEGIRQALTDAGISVDEADPADAQVVVVGWDPEFDFDKMNRAAAAARRGIPFFATNSDATFPAPGGEQWPGAGALLASIEVAAGRRATIAGKPHDPMLDAAAARLGGRQRIAIVGDRPETDLAGGRKRGWTTVLVLTGVTSAEEAERLDPQPDLILPSIADLALPNGY